MNAESNLVRGVRALALGVALAVGGIVAAAVTTLALASVVQSLSVQLSLATRFGLTFLGGGLGFVGVALGYLRYRDRSISYIGISLPSLRELLWAVGGYLSAIALLFASIIVLTLLQVETDTKNRAVEAGMENPELLLWLIPISFVIVAPAEEFLYRGVIQSRLRETFKPVVAIPVTAGIFAAIHFFSLTGGAGGRVIAISVLFLPSLVFGTVYEKTDNLVVPILIHGAYNSTLSILIYVSLTYAGSQPALL